MPDGESKALLLDALWAVEWLVSLVDDGRIADLDDDDKYVDRVDQLRIRLARATGYAA